MISRWRSRVPHIGEYMPAEGNIIANKSKKTFKLNVSNTGDRPIQVGSHTHFAEVNKALEFDREKALGFHLNISSRVFSSGVPIAKRPKIVRLCVKK